MDEEFLFGVYASTRAGELGLTGWSEPQKGAFLRMQFSAQSRYYAENYPEAQFQLILLDDLPVGRLYLDRREREIRIMDIALLPKYRNQGIGSAIMGAILKEGDELSLPISIHVERFNPALQLYQRLGFCQIEDKGVYLLMKRSPASLEGKEHVG